MELIVILVLVFAAFLVVGYVKHLLEEHRRRMAPPKSMFEVSLPSGVEIAEPAWARLLAGSAGPGQGGVGLLSIVQGRDGYEAPELTQFVTTAGDPRALTSKVNQLMPGATTRDASRENPMLELLAGLEEHAAPTSSGGA